MSMIPKLGDFSSGIILNAGQFSGGDKPRPYHSIIPFEVNGNPLLLG